MIADGRRRQRHGHMVCATFGSAHQATSILCPIAGRELGGRRCALLLAQLVHPGERALEGGRQLLEYDQRAGFRLCLRLTPFE